LAWPKRTPEVEPFDVHASLNRVFEQTRQKGDIPMNRFSVIAISTFLMALPASTMRAATLTIDQASAKKAQATLLQINSQIENIYETASSMGMQSREPDKVSEQGEELNDLSAQINLVGQELKALESKRELLPAWQIEAIGTILPSMHDIAEKSTDAIALFNKSQSQLFASNYPEETDQIGAEARKTATFLSDDLKLEKTQAKEARFADQTGRELPEMRGQ
jgi:hypothetical protein